MCSKTFDIVIIQSSNRTFMELKSINSGKIVSEMESSNRTFMELKYRENFKFGVEKKF